MSILLADIDATCAALGYYDGEKYQAEPDALQGLKHLIWILRRDLDNHEYRRHLGRAKMLQTDLVYMLSEFIEDEELMDVIIRLLVILTNPTLLLYRDGPPKDNHSRKVFMELIHILQGYKSAFTRDAIWTALFGKLKQALEIDWSLRSEEQGMLMERILVLIRNVLQVPANPEAECGADNDASVHDQVIWALHQSGMLDLVLFVISSPDEHQYHLHGLEILCLLYREQTAESLADASLQRSAAEKQRDEQELMAARRREKARQHARAAPSRHSRFGGTYVIRNLKSVSDRDIICHQPLHRVTAMDFDREKQQQKRSFRHVKEEEPAKRRSAFSVRLCLREYCIEVLRSAYNTLVRQVRRVLERNAGSTSHDDSYLLWAIRFFMQFNRLSGLQLELVSESLSVQCFHWVLTRIQHHMDMIVSDKKQARLWAKRLHVALQTFRELLQSLLALQKLNDNENASALFDMLLNNVCYVLEYRETILYLLMNYNEAHSTKTYLCDVVETANLFIKMMEKFCKDSVVVQDKRRLKRRGGNKKQKKQSAKPQPETEEELANKWAEKAEEVGNLLSNELALPEQDLPIPFDATSDKSIDDQREDCMIRLNKLLRTGQDEQAIALLRAAREVWPENDVFGAISAAPEDELLLLREIFMHNITTVEPSDGNETEDEEDEVESDDEEVEDSGLTEKTFKFDDFARRLLHPKVVRACTVVLTDWERIPTKSLKAAVTILHRIAYGCSCPAMLYQAKLFRIFQQVLNMPRDAHQEELRRLAIFVVRKFVKIAPTNPKIYAELLFYKTIKEANELETGYCCPYESGTKGVWTEEEESELRFLFEENQRNPETDKDVIDWILENLANKTRTRRGILKKLKDLGLQFKAPTKKTNANAANKNLWQHEEDEELRSLYDQYRIEDDCLERIMSAFEDRRNKQQIIKRMLQLYIIADKSEILPQKPRKRQPKNNKAAAGSDNDEMSEPMIDEDIDGGSAPIVKAKKPKKQQKAKQPSAKAKPRKIVKTPLDVGTVRALLADVDSEKYQEAIDWFRECLDDAADDEDEPAEEDDGVPILPLQELQKEAMEDTSFKKVLVALGMQPPIVGMENYWRIPTYLNSADLKFRAKIVGGEVVDYDLDEASENVAESEKDSDDEVGAAVESDASEEDYLDKRSKERQTNIAELQQSKLNSLMYSKSDEESDSRAPLKKPAKAKQQKKRGKKQKKADDNDLSEDENDLVNEIKRKLERKKRQPDVSSDDEVEAEDDAVTEVLSIGKKKKTSITKPEEEQPTSKPNTEALFDQLKAKRANKIKPADETKTVDKNVANEQASDDELNFNSEDYRKRLLELGDSDNDDDDDDDDDDGGVGKEDDGMANKEHTLVDGVSGNTSMSKNRTRRANVIDSDSDEHADDVDDDDDGVTTVSTIGDDGDKTSNQRAKKKRPRSQSNADDDDDDDVDDKNDSNDEDAQAQADKKSTKEAAPSAKRRRIAIIDDDDDDDEF